MIRLNQSDPLSKKTFFSFFSLFSLYMPSTPLVMLRPTILSTNFHSIGDRELNFDYIVTATPRNDSKSEVDWDCFYTKAEWNDHRPPPSDWINGRLTNDLQHWYRPIHPFNLDEDPCSLWVSWTSFDMKDQTSGHLVAIKTLGLTSEPWPADTKPEDLEITTAWDYNIIARKIEEERGNTNILDETIRLGGAAETTAEISEAVAATLKPILEGIISKIDNAGSKAEANGSLSGTAHVNTALASILERFDTREKRAMEEEEERKAKRQKMDDERQAKKEEKEKQLELQQAAANQFYGNGRGRGGRGGFNQGNRNYGFPAGSNGYFSGNFPVNGNDGASNNTNSALEKMAKDIETLAAKVATPIVTPVLTAPAAPVPPAAAPPAAPAAAAVGHPLEPTAQNLEALIQPLVQRALENQSAQQVAKKSL